MSYDGLDMPVGPSEDKTTLACLYYSDLLSILGSDCLSPIFELFELKNIKI